MPNNDLGEYKVIISADYTKLQADMAKATEIISQSAKGMQASMAGAVSGVNASMAAISDGVKASMAKSAESVQGLNASLRAVNTSALTAGMNGVTAATERTTASIQGMSRQMGLFGSMAERISSHLKNIAALTAIMMPIAAIKTIADVEQGMAGMIQVLPQLHNNQQAVNDVANQFIGIAEVYGVSVDKIIDAGKLWGRGYKDVNEVMQLTSLSAKLAVADMMDIGLANRSIEGVISAYGRQSDAVSFATHIVDAWTNIAHNAQSSATDLAESLTRSAAAANSVGVSMDTLNALSSAAIKSTGRSGAEIGNMLKSVFSSIHSDKAVKDIQNLGIEMYTVGKDGTKAFRDVGSVITDLMVKTHTTTQSMEKDLQAIAGGKFQWSKTAALLGSYADFIKAYNLSINSANFSQGQIDAQLDTISRKMEQVKATATGLLSGVGSAGLSTFVKETLDSINNLLRGLQMVPPSVFSTIGAIVKLGVVGYGSAKVFMAIRNSIMAIKAAMAATAAATAIDTSRTAVNTIAQQVNNLARGQSVIIARSEAGALALQDAAKGIDIALTEEATAATTAWAAATTVATAGLNLVVAALAATVAVGGYYTSGLGEEANAIDKTAQATQNNIEAKQQELEMSQKQTEFIGTLGNAYVELKGKLAEVSEGDENAIKIKKDLGATEDELTKLIGKDGMERIKSSDDVQAAIKEEQKKHSEKTESIKLELASLKKEHIKYTGQQIEETQRRLKALQTEGTAWETFGDLVSVILESIVHAVGRMLVAVGSMEQSLSRNPITGNVWSQSMQDRGISNVAEGLQRQRWISPMKASEIEANRQKLNSLRVQYDKERLEGANDVVTQVAPKTLPEEQGGGQSGAGSKSGGYSQEADNSPEGVFYKTMTQTYHMSPEMVAGLMGNVNAESGFNPAADNGSHWGIGQWDSHRWSNLQNYVNAYGGSTDDLKTQIGFMHYELTQGEETAAYNAALASSDTSPEAYADIFNRKYERSGVDSWPREQGARGFYNRFASNSAYIDPVQRQNNQYQEAYKMFDAELKRQQDSYTKSNRYWSANDTKSLYDTMMQAFKDSEQFKSEDVKLQQAKLKDDAETKTGKMEKDSSYRDAGGPDAVQAVLDSVSKKAGEGKEALNSYESRIYEHILKLMYMTNGSPERYREETSLAKDISTQKQRMEAAESGAAGKHIQALDSMTEKEMEAAAKVGAISSQDIVKYQYKKNEQNYAREKPMLEEGLAKTAQEGKEEEIIAAYRRLTAAKTEEEAKQAAHYLMTLAKEVEATQKAVDKLEDADNKYFQKKQELEDKAAEYSHRYAEAFRGSWVDATQSAFEGILNKTQSVGNALRSMLNAVRQSIVKVFAQDLTKYFTQGMNKILSGMRGTVANTKTMNSVIAQTAQNTSMQMQAANGSTISSINQGWSSVLSSYLINAAQMVAADKSKNAIMQQDSSQTKTSVLADLGTMLAQMLAEMAIMMVMSALFGGGGSETSTSTSSVNLGRNPDSYYSTPTAVQQVAAGLTIPQFSVPGFDTGAWQLPSDMLAMVHQDEMVIPADLAANIRNSYMNGGSRAGGNRSRMDRPVVVKPSMNVSTVDSRGFDRVLKDYNRSVAKAVKQGIRNGHLTARGLI